MHLRRIDTVFEAFHVLQFYPNIKMNIPFWAHIYWDRLLILSTENCVTEER